jgi:hypothetical protein
VRVLAPVVVARKGYWKPLFERARKLGLPGVRVDGVLHEPARDMDLSRFREHDIELVVARLKVTEAKPLREALDRALDLAKGSLVILPAAGEARRFSLSRTCPRCGVSFPDPDPRSFSFASKHGACAACEGKGAVRRIDADLLLDRTRSIEEGALAVYEATVRVIGPNGGRAVPMNEIFAGVKKTTLQPGELIEAVFLPFPDKTPTRGVFRKVGTRAAQAISKTMFAGLIWTAKDGAITGARLAFGSLAPTVRRLYAAEGFLRGRRLNDVSIAAAAELLTNDVSPIDDIRSTREYRLTVSRNLLVAFLKGELK